MQDATNNLNGLINRLETMQTQFKSSGVNGRTNLSESLVSEFSSLFHEFVSAVKSTKHLGGSLNLNELNVDGVQKLSSDSAQGQSGGNTTATVPTGQAMQSAGPAELDFKIKYVDAGTHPISGRKMYAGRLLLDDDVVYKTDNLYSRQAVKEALNTVMAEIKAEQKNADQFVKLNYGTELLKVTPTGERIAQSGDNTTATVPTGQAMQSAAPAELDFKIKYVDAGTHPISGRKMYAGRLLLDDDVVYKTDNLYSRQAVKEALNTVMAEIKAEQKNADQFVKLNYGTELLKVTPTGERIAQSGDNTTATVPTGQAMQSAAPAELDFKIKYVDAGTHPISGRKMYAGRLLLDDDVVYKTDNLYSRQAVKEALNTVMAEIKAEQKNADQFVKLNYGTELLKVTPTGERIAQSLSLVNG